MASDSKADSQTPPEDDHGQSLAAWVTVFLIIIAFVIGTLAVILGWWAWFWASAALVVIAPVIGKLLSLMGQGSRS